MQQFQDFKETMTGKMSCFSILLISFYLTHFTCQDFKETMTGKMSQIETNQKYTETYATSEERLKLLEFKVNTMKVDVDY